MTRLFFISLIIFAAGLGSTAQAQPGSIRDLPQAGKVALTPYGGTEFDIDGTVFGAASESLTGTFLGGALSTTVTFSADEQSFSDVYELPMVFGFGFNYGLSKTGELFGGFRYTRAEAKEFDALGVSANITFAGVAVLSGSGRITGEFDDYKAFGGEIGYRHFFLNTKSFTPFVSGALGFKKTQDINLDLSFNGASLLDDVKFYDDAFTGTAALGFGFRYNVSQGVTLGVETGLRFEGSLSEDDTDLTGGGSFENINDDGDRLSFPLLVRLNIAL